MAYRHLEELDREWRQRRREIERRLADFRRAGAGSDERLFREMAFCLFAVQTSAHRSDDAVRALAANGLLWRGSVPDIAAFLRQRVRFHNHKAAYLVAARDRWVRGDSLGPWLRTTPPTEAREQLVRDLDGFGYKEASHFLRNVGRGETFAILDRHILRNLRRHNVIRSIPGSLSRGRYLEIEEKVRGLSRDAGVPMAAIDLLFWSRETGEVFK
ncbi:MAG TPA: DNA lyase [Thermoplasmata archaeon]|nr:DNA lyase [Thermoplasmata archaeon]